MGTQTRLTRIAVAILMVNSVLILDARQHAASAQTAAQPAQRPTPAPPPRPAPTRSAAATPAPSPAPPIDPAGTTRDASGRIVETTSPLGRATRYEYVGQTRTLKAIVHPDGTRQEFEYDSRGRVLLERAGGVTLSAYTYRADGKVSSYRLSGQPEVRLTYTTDGRLKSLSNALGHATEFEYDARGNLIRETSPLGGVTSRTYDAKNQLTSVTFPGGGVARYQYDPAGRLSQQTNELGGVTRYEYDGRGALVAETSPAGGRTQYDYAAGDLVRVIHPGGATERFTRNAQGQIVEAIDSHGVTHQYEYDDGGQRVRMREGGLEINFEYDRTGRLVAAISSADGSRKFDADDFGRVVAETDAAGSTTRYRWDVAGNITAIVDARGRARQLDYNAAGLLAGVREANGDEGRLLYDPAGRVHTIQRPSGGSVSLDWDGAGRLVALVDPTRLSRRFTYDTDGRRTGETDPTGRSQRISYDAAGRVTAKEGVGLRRTTFSYDTEHRLISADDGAFPMQWSYDAGGNIASVMYGAVKKTVRSDHDARGRRTRFIDGDGRAVDYAYDAAGQLTAIALPGGQRMAFAYNPSGRVQSITYPNGVVAEWTYDRLGQPLSATYRRNTQVLRRIDYTYDAIGNVLTKRDSVGGLTSYSYDAAGQLLEETNGSSRTAYRYGAGGNRLTKETGSTAIDYRYDLADRLVASGTATLSYDGNGYPTEGRDGQATTRFATTSDGRLASVQLSDNRVVALDYGPTGERVSRSDSTIDGGRRRFFLHDGRNLVQQVDEQGRTAVTFVHGPDLDRPFAAIKGSDVYFLHPDRLGSIVLVTDARGAAVSNMDYDAFGNDRPLPSSGGRPAPRLDDVVGTFGFAGREREGRDTGLYNFRARHYQPAVGRFLTADALVVIDDPLQLNPFLYAKNNPLRNIDPFGLSSQDIGDVSGSSVMPNALGTGGISAGSSTMQQILLQNLQSLREQLAEVGPVRDVFPDHFRDIKAKIDLVKEMLRENGSRVPPDPRAGMTNNGMARPGRVTGPVNGPSAAPPEVPSAPTPEPPVNAPANPFTNARNWVNQNQRPVMLAVSAAQLAVCVAQAKDKSTCFLSFAIGAGLGQVAKVVIVAKFGEAGVAFMAKAAPVLAVIAVSRFTVVQLTAAGHEAYAAAGGMQAADQAAVTAARQMQAQADQLAALRGKLTGADQAGADFARSAENYNFFAARSLDAAAAALARIPNVCAQVTSLREQLETIRREVVKKAADLALLIGQAKTIAGNCRTAAQAADIRTKVGQAAAIQSDLQKLLEQAAKAKAELVLLIPQIISDPDSDARVAQIRADLEEARRTIEEATARVGETTANSKRAIAGVPDFNRRVTELRAAIDQAEKTHNDLSFQEWVADWFRMSRPDMKKEFDLAREKVQAIKLLDTPSSAADGSAGARAGNIATTEGLRKRYAALREQFYALACTVDRSGNDELDAIRRAVDDGKIEMDEGPELLKRADACSTTTTTTSTPAAPPTSPTPSPTRPDPAAPRPTGQENPASTTGARGEPARPGAVPPTGGVQFTPAPPPRLMASLDCGPILELVPGQISKPCHITVTGWRSNTTTPVEILIDPLVGGVQASPGDTAQAGDTMYAAGVSDRSNQYIFSEGFSAPRGAATSSQTIMITVRQRGHALVQLPLTLNVVPVGAPAGITISPPAPNVPGTGGPYCVWQYKLTGDRPECWNFVGAVCTSTRYAGRPEYVQVGNSMTWSQADARIGQLSSYFADQYSCRTTITRPPTPPAPPAVVTQGSGGIYSVWRYKLFGDAPQCFHFVAAQSGKYGPPYELVGADMTQSQADARIGELSRYFDDQLGCRAANTTQPPPPPPTTQPQAPVPPPPPQVPEAPPVDVPLGPAVRALTRFGIFPVTVAVNIGDQVQLRAVGVYSDAPNSVVDISSSVRWGGDKPQSFTTSAADAGRTFTITATALDGSTTSATVTVTQTQSTTPQAATPTTTTSNQQPGNNVPSLFGGSTTRTDPGTIASGGRGAPLNAPPPAPPAPPPPPPPGPGAGGTGSGSSASSGSSGSGTSSSASTGSGPARPCDAALFAKIVGDWKNNNGMGPATFRGTCDNITGSFTYDNSPANVPRSQWKTQTAQIYDGRITNGGLQFKYRMPWINAPDETGEGGCSLSYLEPLKEKSYFGTPAGGLEFQCSVSSYPQRPWIFWRAP